MALPLAKADLIGTLLETICYGERFMPSSIIGDELISCRRNVFRALSQASPRAGRPTILLLSVALMMLSLVTTHLALQINHTFQALTDHMDLVNAPSTYSRTVSKRYSAAKASIYTMLTLICDALMVYRVFVIHEHNWLAIAIPSVLLLANTSMAVWYIWSVSQAVAPIVQISSFYAITLTLNLLCTAAIYSCVHIALIVTNTMPTNGLWIVLDPMCPIIVSAALRQLFA
ncbi:uncharacterized protein PHACADRAFT_182525 [Phanerochaete carnosa HHB-10118-sp]|uniref:Uncharacterized protein n=1 Tax=Phanerochaete carnosa (strain HHB-10118-sp) TaxID=650164 RepID=K5X5L6_PHACS|nr:uncharacterized protein PHACADRAFT_182525 [Phanerochaete carnosa HHB-10118-sp]EKM58152.1 hypothetical protein PHACADRAFT_182525 [Phanerochaete carnosa HHB-10118-sp]